MTQPAIFTPTQMIDHCARRWARIAQRFPVPSGVVDRDRRAVEWAAARNHAGYLGRRLNDAANDARWTDLAAMNRARSIALEIRNHANAFAARADAERLLAFLTALDLQAYPGEVDHWDEATADAMAAAGATDLAAWRREHADFLPVLDVSPQAVEGRALHARFVPTGHL